MIPVMVFLCLLMVMGLIGNGMVCFYYGWKTRRTTNSIFICTVAIYDLLICSLSIPIELVDLRFFYVFTNIGACKFLRFINHFAAIGSAFTLLVIAVDRYRRICQPFKKQLTLRDAKIACVVFLIASIFFSWPAFVLYSSVPVELKTKDGINITGSDCTTIRRESYRPYVWIYNGIHMVGFIISVALLCVMYVLVGRVLLKHKLTQQKYTQSRPSSENTNSGSAQTTISEHSEPSDNRATCPTDKNAEVSDEPTLTNGINLVTLHPNGSIADLNNVKKKSPGQFDIKTVKFTVIMLVITIVFIVSFLPYLILVIWRAVIGGHEDDVLSDSGLVAFQFGIRSYFLNSAINPLTYGFFNSRFRYFFFKVFCPCCIKKIGKVMTFSSGTGNS